MKSKHDSRSQAHCRPPRGISRDRRHLHHLDDLLPSLRVSHHRAVIANRVGPGSVSSFGLYYRGPNYELQFADEPDEP
jgi:hypothetical protein